MKRLLATTVLAAAGALAVAGCGGSSSPSGTPATPGPGGSSSPATAATAPADPAAAKAQITTVWTAFFNSGTPRATAAGYLEDGDQLGQAMKIAARLDKQQHLDRRAKVQLIRFISPTTASVTWTLMNGTTPLLPNASGQAVLVGGQWKVSKLTFCTLVELGNNSKPVPGCSSS